MPLLQYLSRLGHARASGQYVSESPAQVRVVTTPNEFPEIVTIGKLSDLVSDNVLLNIFRYYLDVSPRHHWPRLVHICLRWRRIVFASQRALHIRMFCTHGTPVLKTLCCWPATPIIVQFGGSPELYPPAPKDEGNIMTVLKQSGRVSSINLTTTRSLLKRFSSIKRPFSELEDLVLLSRDGVRLMLPSAFRWGSRLRCLHSTRIAIPGLLQLLYSSTNLVDLQLHDAFDSWEYSPEALTNALSGMVHLRSLSLHLPSTTNHYFPPPSGEHIVLLVLTRLNFRGTTEYLEGLVVRIDAPRLENIEISFFNKLVFDVSVLGKFIDRIKIQKLYRRAHILSSRRDITISLIQPGAPACLKLQLFCEPSSEQLLFMTQVCNPLSAFLSNVEDLRISMTRPLEGGDSDYSGWRDLLISFTGVRWFHLDWDHSTNIVRDVQLPNRGYETMLPSLHILYTPRPGQRRAALGKAVVSFMVLPRFSGHMAVEYERLCHINELRETGPRSQQVTIEMLSDDILLNICRHCLDLTPQIWPTLVCVCQRWRQIVFASPLGLDLRLYCTYGTPVLKTLDFWPPFPLVVKYGGSPMLDPPALEDDDNIVAALKQFDRVGSISLTVTHSLLESLSSIFEPFSELEELVLLSKDNVQMTLSSTFRWGPRLRTLRSTRIAFLSLPQLLSPSRNLVDIQLHEIPSAGYFSPEAFANALSGMTNLRTLSLHFLSLPPRRNYLGLPSHSGERIALPALRSLKYRGTSKYLDSLVAKIDASHLGDIDITFFSQPTMDASQLGRFIERTEVQTSLSQSEVKTSRHAISISFTSSGNSTPVRLQISNKQLDWQLSSVTQICDQFSPFIFRVKNLGINTTQALSGQDDVDGRQWLELIRSFGGAGDLWVGGGLMSDILGALGSVNGGHAILPALHNIRAEKPMTMHGPSWEAVQSFIASRSLSGRPIQVYSGEYSCHICYAGFMTQRNLKTHLTYKHALAYRVVCSYCGDFECELEHNDLFPEHLRNEHPEVARNDPLISNPFLRPFNLGPLVDRHTSLRAPESHPHRGDGAALPIPTHGEIPA
ncbi:hypothetical protein EDB83DRAFT_737603 [Lactarius deliciosus]|nr:hypothetical protein EDB83DRAFT_737603 [Lactarius deliciosus]